MGQVVAAIRKGRQVLPSFLKCCEFKCGALCRVQDDHSRIGQCRENYHSIPVVSEAGRLDRAGHLIYLSAD